MARTLQIDTGAARAAVARDCGARRSVLDALMLEETLRPHQGPSRQAEPNVAVGDFEQRLVVLAMTLPPHRESD